MRKERGEGRREKGEGRGELVGRARLPTLAAQLGILILLVAVVGGRGLDGMGYQEVAGKQSEGLWDVLFRIALVLSGFFFRALCGFGGFGKGCTVADTSTGRLCLLT